LQVAAAQIYELLCVFDPSSLKEDLIGDSQKYARLVNVLARLGDGADKYTRYRAQVAECKARLAQELRRAQYDHDPLTPGPPRHHPHSSLSPPLAPFLSPLALLPPHPIGRP